MATNVQIIRLRCFRECQSVLLWLRTRVAEQQIPWEPLYDFVLRGLVAMPDGSAMLSVQQVGGAGSIQRLHPDLNRLTVWTLPEPAAPFSGALAPDGTLLTCRAAESGGSTRAGTPSSILPRKTSNRRT